MSDRAKLRFTNPFREATSSELIENPNLYSQIFSHEILVNETLDVFERNNVVLTGPQGTGKTMILSLFNCNFLSACLENAEQSDVINNISPYASVSINLVRSGFHVFGRRSPSRAISLNAEKQEIDAACASDFLAHYLFKQFVTYIRFLLSDEGKAIRSWMGVSFDVEAASRLAEEMSSWACWRGYYAKRKTLEGLIEKCDERLLSWYDFLNINTDSIPSDVWETKFQMETALHRMGALTASLSPNKPLPLYVVIDQYEALPELNQVYGSSLQRIVNSLIKARDPYVFYKVGARPYDWGKELRVWGAESRIEVDRDYKRVDLNKILRRKENDNEWLFPAFARDVAYRRLRVLCSGHEFTPDHVEKMFGPHSNDDEANSYVGSKAQRRTEVLRLDKEYAEIVFDNCGEDASILELRLASAWVLQRIGKKIKPSIIKEEARELPWTNWTWRKERVEIALLQIASITNQRKKYYGWDSVKYLSGSDIRAFLRICEEVWEIASKIAPESLLTETPVPPNLQTEGIFLASHHWRERDKTETHQGSMRYAVISRLGPSIHDSLIDDLAISNPGHTGFSVREPDLAQDDATQLREFLGNGANWAIFEERPHTSKNREGATRSKWFLHPILSPAFGIPLKRAKEPYYTTIHELIGWFFRNAEIRFGTRKQRHSPDQRQFDFGEEE